jgi:hypothetical protein
VFQFNTRAREAKVTPVLGKLKRYPTQRKTKAIEIEANNYHHYKTTTYQLVPFASADWKVV